MIFISYFSFLDHAFPGQLGFQFPASNVMFGIINLHHFFMFFIVIIVVFVFSLIFLILQYATINTSNNFNDFLKLKDINNVNIAHGPILEIIWIVVPTLILMLFAIPSFSLLYSMEAFTSTAFALKVIGHQWYWTYELTFVQMNDFYPIEYSNVFINNLRSWQFENALNLKFDSYMVDTSDLKTNDLRLLETTNPLVLPYNVGIKVLVTADDVLHSWAVPCLGIKVDAVPGRINEVFLKINRPGHFYGQCSEICGVNHGFMPISIYAVNLNDFIDYLYINFYDKFYALMPTSSFFYLDVYITQSTFFNNFKNSFGINKAFDHILNDLCRFFFNTVVKNF